MRIARHVALLLLGIACACNRSAPRRRAISSSAERGAVAIQAESRCSWSLKGCRVSSDAALRFGMTSLEPVAELDVYTQSRSGLALVAFGRDGRIIASGIPVPTERSGCNDESTPIEVLRISGAEALELYPYRIVVEAESASGSRPVGLRVFSSVDIERGRGPRSPLVVEASAAIAGQSDWHLESMVVNADETSAACSWVRPITSDRFEWTLQLLEERSGRWTRALSACSDAAEALTLGGWADSDGDGWVDLLLLDLGDHGGQYILQRRGGEWLQLRAPWAPC